MNDELLGQLITAIIAIVIGVGVLVYAGVSISGGLQRKTWPNTIGSVNAFTERAVKGVTANREKAEGWLAKNAIIVTALNPVIGYVQGAALVKEALAKNASIRELAVEKAKAGALKHRDESRPVSVEEIESALRDLRKLTDGGIAGGVSGGG